MANPADDRVGYPFTAFDFAIEIRLPGRSDDLCSAAFSECDGLEMTMDVKTIKEGGNNATLVRLPGQLGYGTLTLKRGMTASFDLWDWFSAVVRDPTIRADGEVVLFAPDRQTERVRFVLGRCLPTKLKAPALNARDGMVAIEELQLAYETMVMKSPEAGTRG
jgi:phage tail-like protein